MVVKTSTTNVRGITPDQTSDLIVLPVERASVAIQASTLIATEATRTHIPLVTEDPSAAWVAEGDEIGASDPKIDDVVVEPAKIAGLTVVTNELARDSSPAAQNIIGDGLSRDIARKIDLAFFGSRGANLVQPKGLGDLTGFSAVAAGAGWVNLDPFAEAIANADGLGLTIDSFVANPADALALAKLKETTTGSNKPLLGSDPTAATRRLLQGVPLLTSPGVAPGTVWGIPKVRAIVVRRLDVELDIDSSAYFTSDRTAIRAVMRVSFAFPHAAAIQKIKLAAA